MAIRSLSLSCLPLLAVLLGVPAVCGAQMMVQPLGTTDADRLAAAMRQVAANPADVGALVEAGDLSLGLGDLSGAASLFARAERVDPRNGRVKAGMGSILVRAERPGEALRYFTQAEQDGAPVSRFAADRGLAFDLIGEQERAQRDYRLALRTRPDDETLRRYALSLGISGQRDQALAQLAPLIQRSDRGAWRARAFILAMNGDVAQASRIATTMMPAGMATGLQPFFTRLPSLPAADRAFAVHFGEVRATQERVADARLAPAFPPLGPDAYAPRPVVLAAQASGGRSSANSRRDRGSRVQTADRSVPVSSPIAARPAVVSSPAATVPGGQTPAIATAANGTSAQGAARAPATVVAAAPGPVVTSTPAAPARVAANVFPTAQPAAATMPSAGSARMAGAPMPGGSPAVASAMPSVRNGAPTVALASARAAMTAVPPAATMPSARMADASMPAGSPAVASEMPSASNAAVPVALATAPPAQTMAATSARAGVPAPGVVRPGFSEGSAAVTNVALPPSEVAAAPVPTAAPPAATRVSDDMVLARIVASLSIPASELGVTGPARATPAAPEVAPARLAEARDAVREEAAEKQAAVARIDAHGDGAERTPPPGGGERRRAAATAHDAAPGRRGKRDGNAASADEGNAASDEPVSRRSRREDAARADADGRARRGHDAASDEGEVPAGHRSSSRRGTERAAADDAPDTHGKAGRSGDRKAAADGKSARETASTRAQDKAARANPERIWVQVAGGATESDLPKAWAAAKAKAPTVFAGHGAYTTPLRATNRVLAGPFKTDADARAFVNQLAKKGVSAFTFTSDKGQAVTKLPAK